MNRHALVCSLLAMGLSGAAASYGPASSPQQAGDPDPFEGAVTAYRAGRHGEALATFRTLVETGAGQASAELLGNLALAALRERRSAEAEVAARRLVELDDAEERALGRFLLAQAALERARVAELAARLPDAEPGIWQSAVDAAERALDHWLQAARERGGWPGAVRNAERAARKLEQLRRERDAAQQESKTEKVSDQPPAPDQKSTEERPPELAVDPLSPAEVRKLRERLQQKEREKRALRRTEFRVQRLGERDW